MCIKKQIRSWTAEAEKDICFFLSDKHKKMKFEVLKGENSFPGLTFTAHTTLKTHFAFFLTPHSLYRLPFLFAICQSLHSVCSSASSSKDQIIQSFYTSGNKYSRKTML